MKVMQKKTKKKIAASLKTCIKLMQHTCKTAGSYMYESDAIYKVRLESLKCLKTDLYFCKKICHSFSWIK